MILQSFQALGNEKFSPLLCSSIILSSKRVHWVDTGLLLKTVKGRRFLLLLFWFLSLMSFIGCC